MMIEDEFLPLQQRILDYWPKYTPDQMGLLWRLARKAGIGADGLSEAVDTLISERESHRPPRLKSFIELALKDVGRYRAQSLHVGDWVEVDAQYSEKFERDKHWGRIATDEQHSAAFAACKKVLRDHPASDLTQAIQATIPEPPPGFHEVKPLPAPVYGELIEGEDDGPLPF